MQFMVRVAQASDEESLWQMLYYAARMSEDGAQSYHEAKTHPDLQEYVADWGQATDIGVVALVAAQVVDDVWPPPRSYHTATLVTFETTWNIYVIGGKGRCSVYLL